MIRRAIKALKKLLALFKRGYSTSQEDSKFKHRETRGIGNSNEVYYKLSFCEIEPTQMKPHHIYVIGDEDDAWLATFICPCGCGVELKLNLLMHPDRPTWRVWTGSMEKASISPSIWRKIGCESHFSLKNGNIIWHHEDDSLV